MISVLMPLSNGVILIELILAVTDVCMIGYAIYSRKYYIRRRNSSEEINIQIKGCCNFGGCNMHGTAGWMRQRLIKRAEKIMPLLLQKQNMRSGHLLIQ